MSSDKPTNLADLQLYTQKKLTLSDILRTVRNAFALLGRKEAEDQCKELMVKLAEDRFTLAVLGQFKRGKSSLMNAIIGKELLPTGVLPLTSAITVLKYGPSEQLIINREGGLYPVKHPVSSLSQFVTEKGNPNNEKKVKTATLEIPEPFLRYGIEFVDTPGVGSAITANTETTYRFLPECDAVLFVTGVDTPMTEVELGFLKRIQQYVSPIFFIVNKIDLANTDEQKEIIAFVTNAICSALNKQNVNLFPVSSRLGLEARISRDAVLFERSGLKALEDALAVFLTREKTTAFLSAVTQKLLRLIETETAQDILTENFLQKRFEEIQKDNSISLKRDPHEAASAIELSKHNLHVLTGVMLNDKIEETALAAAEENKLTEDLKKEEPTSVALIEARKILEDLRTVNCPVCQHLSDQIFDYLVHWQYKLSTDEATQKEWAAQHGFCPLHTWQLLAISSPHGASVGYSRFAVQIAQQLQELKGHEHIEMQIKNLVPDIHSCKACAFLKETEANYIKQFLITIETEDAQELYSHSQGMCLHHLSKVLEKIASGEMREFLLSHSVERFEQDEEDMRTFALKNDALRRALQNVNEQSAYRRFILRFAGDKRICVPWAEDADI